MRTVYKYQLNLGTTRLELPEGSIPVHVGVQGEGVCLWVEQTNDPDGSFTWHTYKAIGTGHPCPTGYARTEHLGTVMMPPFVWHVYECWE